MVILIHNIQLEGGTQGNILGFRKISHSTFYIRYSKLSSNTSPVSARA